jgi:hypothetical protein
MSHFLTNMSEYCRKLSIWTSSVGKLLPVSTYSMFTGLPLSKHNTYTQCEDHHASWRSCMHTEACLHNVAWTSNTPTSTTVENWTHVDKMFLPGNNLRNQLLKYRHKVMNRPVCICTFVHKSGISYNLNFTVEKWEIWKHCKFQ